MDIYLPADFYALRETLEEWRDAGTLTESMQSAHANAPSTKGPNGCADPTWRVF